MNTIILSQIPAHTNGFMGIGIGYWLVMGGSMLLSFLISSKLNSRFNEYSQIPLRVSGAEVARLMLKQNGITDVQVVHVGGHLTDHYDPVQKTVNLSEAVYQMNSVAAAAWVRIGTSAASAARVSMPIRSAPLRAGVPCIRKAE